MRRRPRIAPIFLAAFALVLVAQIVGRTFVAFLAEVEPRWALRLAPGNAEAALRLADRQLGQDPAWGAGDPERLPLLHSAAAQSRIDAAAAKGLALAMVPADIASADRQAMTRAIAARWLDSPLDARAPRLLGQLAESDDAARRFMLQARGLSKREALAVDWLMQDAVLRDDPVGTLDEADILLRTKPELAPYVGPVMIQAAEGPAGPQALEALLEANPPWRWFFFDSLCPGLTHLSLPLDLLLDLRRTGAPPTPPEVAPYLACLIGHGLYPQAHEAWLRLLHGGNSQGDGLLFDGTFQVQSSGTPFDWKMRTDGGVRADVAAAPGKPAQNALRLAFLEQFINNLAIAQTVVLPPGDYVLTGRETGLFTAKHGLRWSVACVDQPYAPFAQSDRLFGSAPGWKDFSFAFTVPPKDCPAQVVNLGIDAVSDSERIVAGEAWFTDLAVTPRL